MPETQGSIFPPTGLYLHWPFCARICPYCDFNVTRLREQLDTSAFLAAYQRDLAEAQRRFGPRHFTSLFLGGGTPSLMPLDFLATLMEWLGPLLAPDAEVTLEANPEDLDAQRLAAWRDLGVNRLSLGVQSLDAQRLAFLGRQHTPEQARESIELALAHLPNTSIDLISARPGDTLADWLLELEEALALQVPHISIYGLTVEPGTAFERQVARGLWDPIDSDLGAEIFLATRSRLRAQGLETYEVSNAARPGFESQHNLLYWRSQDWFGLGPGAHGRLSETVGEAGQGARMARFSQQQERGLDAWLSGQNYTAWQRLTGSEAATEALLMGLRLADGVPIAHFENQLKVPKLKEFQDRGWLLQRGEQLCASEAGLVRLDAILAELLGA